MPLRALGLQPQGMQLLQLRGLFALLVLCQLPAMVHGLDCLRRSVGLQAQQILRGITQRLLGVCLCIACLLHVLHGLHGLCLPALYGLQLLVACLQIRQAGLQQCRLGLQLLACACIQQLHALCLGLLLLQGLAGVARSFENGLRDATVDIGAGQFFEQLGALIGRGLQEGGKASLGQQHGLGKARKVQSGDFGDAPGFVLDMGGEYAAVRHQCQLHPGSLKGGIRLAARAALAPEGAVGHALDFELHLGFALAGVARHDVVAAADAVEARRLVIERKADGIEQRGLASARGSGDGKQAVVGKGGSGEVDVPLALERVQVLQPQFENSHAAAPCSSWRPCSTC